MPNTDQLFRDELRSWFAEHPPPHFEIATSRAEADTLREWQRTLSADRWVGVHWPVEYGGRAASLREVAIYNEECARVAMPPLVGRAGISLVGPTLMTHDERQRTDFDKLPGTLPAMHLD